MLSTVNRSTSHGVSDGILVQTGHALRAYALSHLPFERLPTTLWLSQLVVTRDHGEALSHVSVLAHQYLARAVQRIAICLGQLLDGLTGHFFRGYLPTSPTYELPLTDPGYL